MKSNDLSKSAIIIQSRMSSQRFRGKMMAPIFGEIPLVEYIAKRCQRSNVKNILVATSEDSSDNVIVEQCQKNDIPVMQGDLNNVLRRYVQTAEYLNVEYVVRLCGDTPLFDLRKLELILDRLVSQKLDYVSFERKFCAAGFYSEAVTLDVLKRVLTITKDKEDLEHVTKYILDHLAQFKTEMINVGLNPDYLKNIHLTVDDPEDIHLVKWIIESLNNPWTFSSKDVLEVVQNKETMFGTMEKEICVE